MKKFILFVICLFVAKESYAQGYISHYHPMVKEGKAWNYNYVHYEEVDEIEGTYTKTEFPIQYVFKGDTLINGRQCLKMYCVGQGKESYHSAWYEEGFKVYCVDKGRLDSRLIFDFDLNQDEEASFDSAELLVLDYTDFVENKGRIFFRQHFKCSPFFDNSEVWRDFSICVAGVGSSEGVLRASPMPTLTCICDYSAFISCEEDGEVIFTREDFNKEAYVEPEPVANYRPMLKEGKTWRYTYHHWNHEDGIDDYWTTFMVDYTLRGDTIIDGRLCKKMYQKREGLKEKYYGAWYEDGRKVYVIYPYSPDYPSEYNKPHLLFDFGTAIGETSPTVWGEATSPLLRKEDINVYGQTMKRYVMHEPYGPGTIVLGGWGSACFVEGVGSMRGILPDDMTTCICDYETFDFCYEDGKTIFTKHDFYRAPYEGATEPYRQFLKSGKKWVYTSVKRFPYVEETGEQVDGSVEELFAVELSEPLMIDGKECYRVIDRDEDGVAYSTDMLWYEDGGKVYFVIDEDMSHPYLAFDFNLRKGEMTMTEYYVGEVMGFEDFASNNLSFRRVILEWDGALVEGVGHKNGILNLEQAVGIGYSYSNNFFEACYEGDVCIFTYNDFQTKGNPVSDVDGIEKTIVSLPFSQHGKTYDLQGREVTTPQPGHIYIRDGRKFIAK